MAHAYYAEGNRSALRNRALEAKAWAVANDRPVICNEFGVLPDRAKLEDRRRYYQDVVSLFAELEVPWQHWFTLVDPESGAMEPDIQAGLGRLHSNSPTPTEWGDGHPVTT